MKNDLYMYMAKNEKKIHQQEIPTFVCALCALQRMEKKKSINTPYPLSALQRVDIVCRYINFCHIQSRTYTSHFPPRYIGVFSY